MLLRRVLRKRLVRVSIQTEVFRRVLRRGGVFEGAQKALRRQKHALSQSTTPSRAPYYSSKVFASNAGAILCVAWEN